MNKFYNKSQQLNLEKLKSFYKPRRAKQQPIYYKTECIDCNLIFSVRWEQKYVGILPTYTLCHKPKEVCPFCKGNHTNTLKINEKEYISINEQWDLVVVAETDSHKMDDDSWTQCQT
ncbi:hypothetical protein [Candidatus Parabeggiatoa sp. HSG14]|uniref:hypothetical protein n=1 Tax=Candidatus Parabeggiatoa sp. HSG14 TaxID=3055593 RepID=UPI0025A7068C|nr:hypothetical protein [Thiotrichales bacterium HSG14]